MEQMQQMPQQMQQMPMDDMADAGRATDSVMGHLSLGELVIPRAMLDDPQVMQTMQQLFQAYGADINEFTVGHEANKINPETGYPEFFSLRRIFRRVASVALPIIGNYFGGPIGAAIGGAAGGAVAGGGLRGALIGGALSGIGSGLAGQTGTLFEPGGSLAGSSLHGANMSITGALSPIGTGISNAFSGAIGNFADAALPAGVQGAVRPGSGILGALGGATGITNASLPSLGNVLGTTAGSGGGGSSFGLGNALSSTLGGIGQDSALKRQREQLLAANQQQLGNLENLSPQNVQNDVGYQFAQQQGEQGLNRALGAQGNLFSGRALQAASDFNQDLASRFYGDAYNRQAGLVGAQNQIFANTGAIKADTTGARANNISSSLARAMGSQGMSLEEMRRQGLI